MNGIYLGIGGNQGDRAHFLAVARSLVAQFIGKIIKKSLLYQTAAWGKTDQPDFYNQVLFVETTLCATACMKQCLKIESRLGRERKTKWDKRTIDIDILFFNEEIIQEKELTIPHPFLHKRNFVLAPMAEIAPDFVHPILDKPMKELFEKTDDLLEVKRITDEEENNRRLI